jgi:hypothetical protein
VLVPTVRVHAPMQRFAPLTAPVPVHPASTRLTTCSSSPLTSRARTSTYSCSPPTCLRTRSRQIPLARRTHLQGSRSSPARSSSSSATTPTSPTASSLDPSSTHISTYSARMARPTKKIERDRVQRRLHASGLATSTACSPSRPSRSRRTLPDVRCLHVQLHHRRLCVF